MSETEQVLITGSIMTLAVVIKIVSSWWDIVEDRARRSRELPSRQRPKMIGDAVGGAVDTGYTEAEWEALGYGDNDRWIRETDRIFGELERERIRRRSPAERVVMEDGETYSVYTTGQVEPVAMVWTPPTDPESDPARRVRY